jgi:hypothetical protein
MQSGLILDNEVAATFRQTWQFARSRGQVSFGEEQVRPTIGTQGLLECDRTVAPD